MPPPDKNLVDQLVSLGYSKSKVTQALKDSGNNVARAREILQRLASLSKTGAPPANAGATNEGFARSGAAPNSVGRAKSRNEDALASVVSYHERLSRKRHPCIAQFKSCFFGPGCLLKDYPGDVCIHHFNGSCAFGDRCELRHFIDGVEIKREIVQKPPEDIVVRPDGSIATIVERVHGHMVLIGEVKEEPEEKNFWSLIHEAPPVSVEPSRFNAVQGPQPSYTDPWFDDGERRGEEAEPVRDIPKPFLRLAQLHAQPKPQPTFSVTSGAPSAPVQPLPPTPAAPEATTEETLGLHPCLFMYGECKYGDMCMFAHMPCDVCLHYLRGNCAYGDGCWRRHPPELLAEVHQREAAEDASTAHDTAADSGASARPAKAKHRLQQFSVGSVEAQAAPWRVYGEEGSDSGTEEGSAPHDPGTASGLLSDFLPTSASTGRGGRGLRKAKPLPAPRCGSPSGDTAGTSEEKSALEVGASTSGDMTEEELQHFIGLLDMFPDIEPIYILCALREVGGQADEVADALTRQHYRASTDEMEEYIVQELARENEGSDEVAPPWKASEETLLTLCSVFPALEVSSIEAVLSRCSGDFVEAHNILLHSVENMARGAYDNYWRSGRPTDDLKATQLCGMFSELPADVVRSCFAAAGGDMPTATEALNQLTKEVLTGEQREGRRRQAATWDARPQPRSAPKVSPAPDVAAAAPTIPPNMENLYRNAVREVQQFGDWRRVREQAYMYRALMVQVLGQAAAAYVAGDGKKAKVLSSHGKWLDGERRRLYHLAMLALESERSTTNPMSTLDLHGFHVEEAIEVLRRRIALCVKRGIQTLRIIAGAGKHSHRGKATVFPAVVEHLEHDPWMKANVRITTFKQAYLDVRIRL